MPRLVSELDAGNNRIINLAIATEPADAVRLDYISALEAKLNNVQVQMLNYVQILAELNQQLDQIKTLLNSYQRKDPVLVAATNPVNIQSGGLIAVQGIGLVPNDRVLLTVQSNPSENGIYVVQSGAWQRSSDTNKNSDFATSFEVEAMNGEASGIWQFKTASVPVVLGQSPITFKQLSSTALPRIIPIEKGGTGADNPRSARANLGCVEQITFDYVGDGIETRFRFKHNLNQLYPFVKVFDRTHPNSSVITEEYPLDDDTIEIEFSHPPALNSIAVTIMGAFNPEIVSLQSP